MMEQSRLDDYSHTEAMKRAKRANNLSRDSLPTRRKGGGGRSSRDLEPESESESESESASADEEASDTESESGGGGGGESEGENGSRKGGGDEWRRERRGEVDKDKHIEVRSSTAKGGKR